MMRRSAQGRLWLGWSLITLVSLAVGPPTVLGAQWIVLGEEFSNTG
jgi:hypothetical protein